MVAAGGATLELRWVVSRCDTGWRRRWDGGSSGRCDEPVRHHRSREVGVAQGRLATGRSRKCGEEDKEQVVDGAARRLGHRGPKEEVGGGGVPVGCSFRTPRPESPLHDMQ